MITGEKPDDPETWKWTSADSLFITLISECHKRKIRIIIDGVWNHVGINFWAFQDVKKNQQKSPFKNWFTVKTWDDPDTPGDEFKYQCWFDIPSLPEIREDETGFYPPAWEYMKYSIKKWMDPNGDGDPEDGVDGWRLDVADKVGFPTWRKFCRYVRSINPETYIIGEVWWEDWPEKMYNAAPWLGETMFDAVKNYRWARLVQNYFIDIKNKITASEFEQGLTLLLKDYPEEFNYVLTNLMDIHDTDRLASNIVNPDFNYDASITPKDDENYSIRKPNSDERKIQKLILLFQMTYLGAPMVYYGDEAGMWGADDPDCRKPMVWPDKNYETESTHPFKKRDSHDEIKFNSNLFNYYKKLINIIKLALMGCKGVLI